MPICDNADHDQAPGHASQPAPSLPEEGRGRRVLVFDSGIGGLGTVASLRAQAPALAVDFLADNAFFPYGDKPDDLLRARIVALLEQAVAQLQPEVVIVACNTASTLALAPLRAVLNVPVVGCVPPVRWGAKVSQTRTLGLLATPATARRGYVQQLRDLHAADCALHVHGSALLAGQAEKAFRGGEVDSAAIEGELAALLAMATPTSPIDVIGLGCTHYAFILPQLKGAAQRLLGAERAARLMWLDPAPAVARQALRRLQEQAPTTLAAVQAGQGVNCFHTTGALPDEALAKRLPELGFGANRPFTPI
ncbi:glutamate racemase [Formicincola oecophyllae]|uniref:Glutamate racemase n=2 Tax=Formicincola oecophyllae TaxID=2558361 RepID=A0A4Y6UE06_9PROT|nr:glutamate racemase [Formicincola oecophyllae]